MRTGIFLTILITAIFLFGGLASVISKKTNSPKLRDYQLELYMDTVWIYDGGRLVGRYTSNWNNQIDSILIKDNE